MTLRNTRPDISGNACNIVQLRYAVSFGLWGDDRFRGHTMWQIKFYISATIDFYSGTWCARTGGWCRPSRAHTWSASWPGPCSSRSWPISTAGEPCCSSQRSPTPRSPSSPTSPSTTSCSSARGSWWPPSGVASIFRALSYVSVKCKQYIYIY